jgi:hypothetical protein
MRKLYKSLLLVLSIITLISCENEKNQIVSANGFNLRKIADSPTPSVLLPVNDADVFTNLVWDISDNGVASVSKYSLVITDHSVEPTLENSVEYTGAGLVVTPTERKCTLKNVEFNELLNKLDPSICSQRDIDIRIKATLGEKNQFINYSNPINLKVTSYPTSPKILSFVKDGNIVSNEPKLLSSGYTSNTDYEGYVYLQAGNYKFVRPDACGSYTSSTALGGTGTLASGVIDATGASNIVIPTAGQYQIKANLATNTFSIKEFTSVGVFGRATRAGLFGFNNIVPMNYDATNKKWTLTMDLLRGQALKFRTIKWTGTLIIAPSAAPFPKPDYIPSGSTTVSTFGTPAANVLADDSNTDIKTAGTASLVDTDKYLVEVDISNPRKYTYKLTKI